MDVLLEGVFVCVCGCGRVLAAAIYTCIGKLFDMVAEVDQAASEKNGSTAGHLDTKTARINIVLQQLERTKTTIGKLNNTFA